MGADQWTPDDSNTEDGSAIRFYDRWVPEEWKKNAGSSFVYYIGIEAAWHTALFAACYRYRPFVCLSKSTSGQKLLTSFRRIICTKNASSSVCSKLQSNRFGWIPGGTRTVVAASEWFFFNKVIGIPLWPTKILLAGWINKRLSMSSSISWEEGEERTIHQENNERACNNEHATAAYYL